MSGRHRTAPHAPSTSRSSTQRTCHAACHDARASTNEIKHTPALSSGFRGAMNALKNAERRGAWSAAAFVSTPDDAVGSAGRRRVNTASSCV